MFLNGLENEIKTLSNLVRQPIARQQYDVNKGGFSYSISLGNWTPGKWEKKNYFWNSVSSISESSMKSYSLTCPCSTDGKLLPSYHYRLPSVPFDHMIEGPFWCFPTRFTDGKVSFTNRAYQLTTRTINTIRPYDWRPCTIAPHMFHRW